LPLRPPTPAEQLPLKSKPTALGQPPDAARLRNLLAGVRVLVVDDQDDARELLATVLEDVGALVKQASSVRMALELLSGNELDVVVSDIGMPHEDGYSLIKSVRSGSGRDLPAVAVTAFARAEDRLRALQAGFQEHVSKPIDPDALVAIVARLARR
jgi:CheY-like chemotaxis protein